VFASLLSDELHPQRVLAGFEFARDEPLFRLDAKEVVDVVESRVLDEQRMAAESGTLGENDAGAVRIGDLHVGEDLVRTPSDVDSDAFRDRSGAGIVNVSLAGSFFRRTLKAKDFQGCAIIQRQHEVLLRLLEPCLDERLELLGVLLGQVFRLGRVHVHMVEFPLVLVEMALACDGGVEGNSLPAVLPDCAGAEHGVVLTLLLGRSVGCRVEGVTHRDSGERVLPHALIHLGHLKPANLQDRRNNVHGMVILISDFAARLDAFRPRDDQRVTGAARVFGVTLEHLERRGEGSGPSGRIVLVGVRPSQNFQVLHVLGQVIRVAVEELVLVDRAVGSAFAGRTVVRRVEDDGVVELAGFLQVVDDAANLNVRVLREPGIDLSEPREQLLLVGLERLPRTHEICRIRDVSWQGIERRQFGALGDDALGDHAWQDPFPVGVVAVVELALVLVDVLLGAMVRSVVRARTIPHEPRLRGVAGLLVSDHSDGLVCQILREVIALLRVVRRLDEPIVFYEVWVPLVGLAA